MKRINRTNPPCSPFSKGGKALVVMVWLLSLMSPSSASGQCFGDCDANGRVAINELVMSVNIALETAALDQCVIADRDSDGRVSVDELVAGVGSALRDCPEQRQTQAFVVTTNFFAGSYATIDLDAPRLVTPSSPQRRIYSDAIARTRDGLVYVLNGLFADNLQVLEPDNDFATRLQCSTGNGTNPHDVAFVNDQKAYVTLYEESELMIINPAARSDCSDFVRGAIDLTSVADADGIPDMDLMTIVGDRLYVMLQRLDINTILRLPADNGALAVIDTTSDSLIDTIELSGENPFQATKGLPVRDGKLYVSQVGLFNELDGGIERVDLATGRAEGFFVTEADLGGDITDFVIVSDTLAYALISRPGFSSALVSFNPTTRQVLDTLTETEGYMLFDIELNDRGELYLADRARQRDGVRIYRASDGMPLVDQPIDVGLAPFEIIFLP